MEKILNEKYISTADFFSKVIDSLQDYAVITLDNDLKINSWSAGASNVFGYDGDEIIGQHIKKIFTEEDIHKGAPVSESQKALQEGRATDNRWHVRKDGSQFFASGLIFPLYGPEGNRMGFVKILRDLTERIKWEEDIKRYVKELEELNNHKEQILAILSHDLRSPVGTIVTSTELFKIRYSKMSEEEKIEMIDSINKMAVNELAALDYLLEWARIRYASETFSPHKIDLRDAVQKIFDFFEKEAEMKQIRLHNTVPEKTYVFADEKMFHSILQNLMSNAIKHTDNQGLIVISSYVQDNMVVISVKDNGAGMSKEVQEKIFSPQFNLLSNTRQENKGAGIGLLLVKSLVEKNGGDIRVESSEGEGTTFTFVLPLSK